MRLARVARLACGRAAFFGQGRGTGKAAQAASTERILLSQVVVHSIEMRKSPQACEFGAWGGRKVLTERDLDRIVFGCGNFGGIGSAPNLRGAGDGEERALRLLDHARRIGLRRFDTANTYGGGASEKILGKWLRSQGASFRRGAQIATKVGNPHGCPPGETPLSRTQIAWHLDQSLRRLGVERIDLYYIHEFDRVMPLDETLEAMAKAVEAGKIARFGVSNASLTDLEAVRDLARDPLASCFEYVQNEYNLLAAADAEVVIPYCAEHGLRYTAFSPLAGGMLTGKYRFGEEPPSGSRLAAAPEACSAYLTEDSRDAIERLRRSAEARGQTMASTALHFVLDTPGVDGLIIAPRRVEHFASYGLEPR
jgi:aryl-alcohol dehydrogenase-like predicted oxidoreductase